MIGLRKSAVSTVTDLLDSQRDALLTGDLQRLSKMEAVLTRALAQLQRAQPERAEMERVKARARRNARLLQAAQSGLETARGHLSRSSAAPLTTYDAQGRSQLGNTGAERTLARR